ncbi:MAG: histidine phosphatase family protein [Pelagimonas sp.]|jgi:alpha-ribazole phosphatase|nr:histidine phosphatase family protein [Pelagimonas sp.]
MGAKRHGAQLVLIRHAPIAQAGILCGRTDAPAAVDPGHAALVAARLDGVSLAATSPALRCRQTAQALWPDHGAPEDARLWEQDFGRFDGAAYADLPDLGVLCTKDLAAHIWEDGESFDQLSQRIAPVVQELAAQAYEQQAPLAAVVHAGVVRAAIGLTLGVPWAGLGFEIEPLSITRLRVGPEGAFSVISSNEVA